jgi:hypothetical protein
MIKFLLSTLITLAIGIFGTLYTVNWQEEKLVFELGEIANFGDLTYQNVRVRNEGWNPATNVVIQLHAKQISSENIKATPKFELGRNENRIGGYERIRRNEIVVLSFVFKGEPITPSMLNIKSDRSIATYKDPTENAPNTDWRSIAFSLGVMVFSIVGLISAIAIPAYQGYRKKALEAASQKAFNDGFDGK